VKRENESIDSKAQKMMKGTMEPFAILTMVRAVPPMVHVIKQFIPIPHMTSPQEKQPRDQG
jgi:hypothetical protein